MLRWEARCNSESEASIPCVSVFVFGVVIGGCGSFRQQTDAQFSDQNFKAAIALIEFHRVRFGNYPDSLADLRFLGSWDQNWLSAVKYRKLEDGYELNLTRGWTGTPDRSIRRNSGAASVFEK
jgi:hypothetical protein